MEKIKIYLQKREKEILSDIERDRIISADDYHNIGLLKEIRKVIKISNNT